MSGFQLEEYLRYLTKWSEAFLLIKYGRKSSQNCERLLWKSVLSKVGKGYSLMLNQLSTFSMGIVLYSFYLSNIGIDKIYLESQSYPTDITSPLFHKLYAIFLDHIETIFYIKWVKWHLLVMHDSMGGDPVGGGGPPQYWEQISAHAW